MANSSLYLSDKLIRAGLVASIQVAPVQVPGRSRTKTGGQWDQNYPERPTRFAGQVGTGSADFAECLGLRVLGPPVHSIQYRGPIAVATVYGYEMDLGVVDLEIFGMSGKYSMFELD